MKKKSSQNNKSIKIISMSIVLLVAGLYVSRAWIRETVLPKTIHRLYGSSIKDVYNAEVDKLQDPIGKLGYTDTSLKNDTCHRLIANKFKTQIICDYNTNLYRDITATEKDTLTANAIKLQALLKANGWQGEYSNEGQPYTSLVKLVTSLTSGIDYQPDATYTKKIGDIECSIGTNTAYSKPKPASMSTQIICSRTFNILGEPAW